MTLESWGTVMLVLAIQVSKLPAFSVWVSFLPVGAPCPLSPSRVKETVTVLGCSGWTGAGVTVMACYTAATSPVLSLPV